MRFRFFTGLLLILVLVAGCQGQVIYIVVTPTQDATQAGAAQVTPVEAATAEAATAEVLATKPVIPTEIPAATIASVPTASETATSAPTAAATDATAVTTQEATPLPPNFPTPVVAEVQVAEQLFEHGRMFWVEPIKQIWVLKITGEGHGTWSVYEDTFVDGEQETDPNLIPPDGRYQPERGFGKLWRESGNLREELGWGITPEFGYVSRYEYHAGGTVDANGQYVAGPGYHIVFSLGGELFRFNETDGTWQLGT
ncbi:MAG: hypothetical protein ABI835_10690 [Chloroflexota bacterium]